MWCVCPDPSVACADCLHSPSPPGVSKTVTVDVKGGGPLWLKLRDLADGITYNFRIRAKTFIYGPEVEANITTGPGEGIGRRFHFGLKESLVFSFGHNKGKSSGDLLFLLFKKTQTKNSKQLKMRTGD